MSKRSKRQKARDDNANAEGEPEPHDDDTNVASEKQSDATDYGERMRQLLDRRKETDYEEGEE